MWELTPLSGGGFMVWDNPLLDVQGGLGLGILAGVAVALPLVAVFSNPVTFAPMMMALLTGVLAFAVGFGAFPPAAALAFPCFTYVLSSGCVGLLYNCSDTTMWVFMVIFAALYVLLGGLGLFGMALAPVFGDFDNSGGPVAVAAVFFGLPIWLASAGCTMDGTVAPSTWFRYIQRAAWIVAAVLAVAILVKWVHALVKREATLVPPVGAWLTAAVGFVPVFVAARFLAPFAQGFVPSLLASLATMALFAAAGFGAVQASRAIKMPTASGFALMLPLLLCVLASQALAARPLIETETFPEYLSALQAFPLTGLLGGLFDQLGTVFSGLFSGVANGVAQGFRYVFELPAFEAFEVPTVVTVLLACLLVWVGASAGISLGARYTVKAQ